MIYMVEQTFSMPELEDEWNAWYMANLDVLLAVPGFKTGQRFQVVGAKPSEYLAMYTLTSGDVFESAIYKNSGGGGTSSQRFRPAYQVWKRNLLDFENAIAVAMDQCLLVCDAPQPIAVGNIPFTWMKTVGLHMTTPWRGIAAIAANTVPTLSKDSGVRVLHPMTLQHNGTSTS